jgi:hypothetical protein
MLPPCRGGRPPAQAWSARSQPGELEAVFAEDDRTTCRIGSSYGAGARATVWP